MSEVTVRCGACGTKVGHTELRDNEAAPEVFVFDAPTNYSLAIAGPDGAHWRKNWGDLRCPKRDCAARYDLGLIVQRIMLARRQGVKTIKVH